MKPRSQDPGRPTPVAEALRERGVPFVLATGYDHRQLPEEALREAPHLEKPLDHHVLADVLARLGCRSGTS